MKGYEQFAIDEASIMGTGIQELLDRDILWDLQTYRIGKQLLDEDRSLVGTAGITKTFRLRSGYSDAEDFAEGANVPNPDESGTMTGPANTLVRATPIKFGIGDTITEEAIDDADFNVIRDHQTQLAEAMANREDKMVWNALLDVTAGTETVTGAGGGATKTYNLANGDGTNSKVYVHVENVEREDTLDAVLGTNVWLDMFLGKIEFDVALAATETATFDYVLSSLANRCDAHTKGSLTLNDIKTAKTKVNIAAKRVPDHGVFYVDELSDLEVDEMFRDASQYGGREVILNGEVGKAIGIKLLGSHNLYPGCGMVLLKGNRVGRWVYKKLPKQAIDDLEKKAGDKFIKAWEKAIAVLIDDRFIAVITNMQSYAKAIVVV